MKPLVAVFPYAVAFWAVFAWAFWPEFRIISRATRPASQAGSLDRGSCRVIMLGTWAGYAVAVPVASMPTFQFPERLRLVVFVAGLAMLVGGSLLRRHCWRMLGASFTGDVRADAGQTIVNRGAYATLRHPSYTAGILMHTGIGVAMGSWGSAAVLALASSATYVYRIRVEERALLATVGEPYRAFIRGKKRLIPFVY